MKNQKEVSFCCGERVSVRRVGKKHLSVEDFSGRILRLHKGQGYYDAPHQFAGAGFDAWFYGDAVVGARLRCGQIEGVTPYQKRVLKGAFEIFGGQK